MCLAAEKRVPYYSRKGYVVVKKGKGPSPIFYGVYRRHFYAKIGERKQAKIRTMGGSQSTGRQLVQNGIRNVKVNDFSGGFYAFKTLKAARAFINPKNTSGLTIVECQFDQVFAEGEALSGWDKYYKAFRAKYRTIIKEVQ